MRKCLTNFSMIFEFAALRSAGFFSGDVFLAPMTLAFLTRIYYLVFTTI